MSAARRSDTWRLLPDEIAGLVCPSCGAALSWSGELLERRLHRGRLDCARCRARWTVDDGLPRLYREDEVRGNDRLLRLFYDHLPRLHDPVVRLTLPLFQSGSLWREGTEEQMRGGYMPRLELSSLTHPSGGEPLRVLEVGIGTGANIAWVRRGLPRELADGSFEYWGLDLSVGMLSVCRRRIARDADGVVRLLMADAHALPFPDARFDRVFHVGALGSFRDPARALAEMARVAKPGTPIVAVDEQLDPAREHGLLSRAMFRLVTFYERHPHAPVEALPAGAIDVLAEQVSPFFYCLRFRISARSE